VTLLNGGLKRRQILAQLAVSRHEGDEREKFKLIKPIYYTKYVRAKKGTLIKSYHAYNVLMI